YKIEEESTSGNNFYRMNSEYGCGNVQVMNFHNQFLIIIANFIPSSDFEKVSEIEEEYFEISQFETDSSYFKVGGRKVKQVDKGICCYANTRKVAYAFCEANKPTCFTKVIITKKYFDSFLEERFGNAYETSKNALDFLVENPNSPELNFVFQQIKDCPAIGNTRKLY
ncbi:AraC family transcriptional regulator, partial [Fusobacterium necrophorum]|nr:AraC family transcriptional regulator [Fusobacterium necrophorum]